MLFIRGDRGFQVRFGTKDGERRADAPDQQETGQ
jgi:hypothetical protein